MQLMLSTDIALRSLILLGNNKISMTIQDMAKALDVSKTHLMKVVMTLVAANYLTSERGRNGGIRLGLAPSEVLIGDIVKLMEANLALVICMKEGVSNEVCPLLPGCRLKNVLQQAQNAFFNSLQQTTLAELIV